MICCLVHMHLLYANGYASIFTRTNKENGLSYPAFSLHSLLAALQWVMHSTNVLFNIFDRKDIHFYDLHMTLDTGCVSLCKEGIGAEIKYAAVITLEREELIWEKGVHGVGSPNSLVRATCYTISLHFCLHGGQEHCKLKRSHFICVPTGYACTTYYQENGSKNYQGTFSETGQCNKVVCAYSASRCTVHIFNLYLSKLAPESTAFYMQPMQNVSSDPSKPWYKN